MSKTDSGSIANNKLKRPFHRLINSRFHCFQFMIEKRIQQPIHAIHSTRRSPHPDAQTRKRVRTQRVDNAADAMMARVST